MDITQFSQINPPQRLLMGPGPINADPRVLRAMSSQLVGQYDPAMTHYMNEVMALYRGVFRTENRWTMLVDGTSRAGIEAILVSAIRPGDKVLVPVFGRFGHLLCEIARRCRAEVHTIDPTDGKQVAPTVGTLGDGASRQMLPTLVFGATSQMQLMQEEIFGPILPVISYERLDDAIAHINAGPRPLALYWFGQSEAVRDDVLRRTVSGGVTVNDTLMHIAHDNLPFGGVGDSGWGAYHGEQGFLRFCHQKSVLVQSRWAMGSLFYPPYGAKFDQVMGLLRRWL